MTKNNNEMFGKTPNTNSYTGVSGFEIDPYVIGSSTEDSLESKINNESEQCRSETYTERNAQNPCGKQRGVSPRTRKIFAVKNVSGYRNGYVLPVSLW